MSPSHIRQKLGKYFWTPVLPAVLVAATATAWASPGYLRSADIHGDQVVFRAEGDLWLCNLDGSSIRRITSHIGDETLPRFSPDGRWIAFAGLYDGNMDVYVMPTTGGEPRRLTWHPAGDYPQGWTPDGKKIIFDSSRHQVHGESDLFTIPFRGGEPEKILTGPVARMDIDPESGRYAFARTYGGGIWKRYRGGSTSDIWVGNPNRGDYRQVTNFDGMDSRPMWHNGRIYLLSDQGGTTNIWSIRPDGSDRRRHTDLGRWDARGACMGPSGRIVFMLAGDLHVFDPADESEWRLPIDLPSERILTRRQYTDPGRYLTDFALAPEGDRVAVVTRGEIFSVPVEDGVTLPVTRGSGARESHVGYDPKGKRLLYVSDESGEQEIITADAWGRGDEKTVRSGRETRWHISPAWSPDGKKIAYGDQAQNLFILDMDGGSPRKVDHCDSYEIGEYAWSPDGRWLAYTKTSAIDIGSIFIYDTKEKETRQVTGWSTSDYSPSWDPKGRYLYFLSNRAVDYLYGVRDFETITFNPTVPCMLLLRSDVENPLAETAGVPPKEEEETEQEESEDEEAAEESNGETDDEESELEPVEIEFEGLMDRFVELPVEAGQYAALSAAEDKVFYLSLPLEGAAKGYDFSGEPEPKATLMAFDLAGKEATPFVSGISTYHLQPGAGKLAFMKQRGQIYVVATAAPPPADVSESAVSLAGVLVELDPLDEWRQIYYEGWRMMRDFYWDEQMNGVDWESIRDQYAELIPRLSSRNDLNDLMREILGELCTSHTYIFGGDPGKQVPQIATGLLGALLVRENDAFRVDRIYRADPADRVRSPLLEPGVDVREGEYILAVNQLPFPSDRPFEAGLENLAGKPVLLTVNDRSSHDGARDVVVTPMSFGQEYELRYSDWVRRNREYVAEKTDGRIGYIHVPDMSSRGMVLFDRWFYPQLDREGMVVDVRWNAGGHVSQLLVNRLMRSPLWFTRARWGNVHSYPYRLLNGPLVVLMNEHSGSDGDFFPAAVQLAGIAPVIGRRSWGGVVGINVDKWLVDGGIETQPEYAPWSHGWDGWGIENRGVVPDIEVENLPQELARNVDAQLDRGIQEVLRLREGNPPIVPGFGPGPDRSRKAYRREER